MSGRRINSNLSPTTSFNLGSRSNDSGGSISAAAANSPSLPTNNSSSMAAPRSRRGASSRGRKDDKKDFNARLICSQIVALQCFHYVFLGLLFQINSVLYGTSVTIDRIFTDQYIKMWSYKGLPDTFAVIISSLVGAVLLAIIVEKSKKVLDFSLTLFLIHLGICTAYSGMPKTWDWWIVNILGSIIMILLGEYVCSLREMSDIPLLSL